MKQLQNDFTTPEQSKRLLELGLPKDSANYYYHPICTDGIGWNDVSEFPMPLRGVIYSEYIRTQFIEDKYMPCWSVGRLMEILQIAAEKYYSICFVGQEPVIHIEDIVTAFEKHIGLFDFSKLEE